MNGTERPETDDGPDPIHGHASQERTPDGHLLTVNIAVTEKDPELQIIEGTLALLQFLSGDSTRRRVLQYVADRVTGDPTFWAQPHLQVPDVAHASREDVARVIAAADGRTWDTMTAMEQSPYLRRFDGLSQAGMTVLAAPTWSPS